MNATITLPVNIEDGYGVIVGKLKHDNFYSPIELIIYKNTVGEFTAEVGDMGEYRLVSDGLFPPDRVWVGKQSASNFKKVEGHCNDSEGRYIEFNVQNGADLNGYIDFEIRVYP